MSRRKAKLVVTLKVVNTTECLELLSLNSCEICTKLSGITGIRLRLHTTFSKSQKFFTSLEVSKAP